MMDWRRCSDSGGTSNDLPGLDALEIELGGVCDQSVHIRYRR